MKKLLSILMTVVAFAAIVSLYSCGEDEPTKPPVAPTLTTTEASNVTASSAKTGGNITSDGNAAVSARGVCWSTNQSPTISDSKTDDGAGGGAFESAISGLEPGVTYYARAYATNKVGTAYGNQVEFTTNANLPTVTTSVGTVIFNGANAGGEVTDDGGAQITERGICWSTAANPTVDDNKVADGAPEVGTYENFFGGLEMGTSYHIRAYAINSVGITYGEDKTLKTVDYATDANGNDYKLVIIGDQIWMAENLTATRYRNGDEIGTGGAKAYANDDTNVAVYGLLYSGTVTMDSRNVCPAGMHVPTYEEWQVLFDLAGGLANAGGALKESGNAHWQAGSSTDEHGFSALPGGWYYGPSNGLGSYGFYWTSTMYNADDLRCFYFENTDVISSTHLTSDANYISVRCMAD